jgi:hypothetical protein
VGGKCGRNTDYSIADIVIDVFLFVIQAYQPDQFPLYMCVHPVTIGIDMCTSQKKKLE